MKRTSFTEIAVSDNEKRAVLQKSTLCRGMDRAELQFIAPFFQCYQLGEGARIYEEGDAEAFLFLIVIGEVHIIKVGDKVITTLGAGETVGEMTIVDEQPRSASAVAVSYSVVYALTRSSLNEIHNKSLPIWAKLFFNIAVNLSYRLRNTSEMLSQFMLSPNDTTVVSTDNEFHPFIKVVNQSERVI